MNPGLQKCLLGHYASDFRVLFGVIFLIQEGCNHAQ